MKQTLQIFFGLFLMLFSVQLLAQTNNLVVFTQDSKPFFVVLNGIRQNTEAQTNVKVKDLEGEFYKVRIIFADGETPDIDKAVSYLEMGKEISLEVIEKKGKYKLRYAGQIDLAQSVDSEEQYDILYHDYEYEEEEIVEVEEAPVSKKESNNSESKEPSGATTIKTEITETSISTESPEGNAKISINLSENGISFDAEIDEDESTSVTTTTTTSSNSNGAVTQTTTSTTSLGYTGLMSNGAMCSRPTMTDKLFLDFKYAIEAENMFNREEFILKAFKNNCMTSEQIAGIIKINYATVNAEKIAKQGYRYTWDTENYGLVIDAIPNAVLQENVVEFLDLSIGEVSGNDSQTYTTTTTVTESYNYDSTDGEVVEVEVVEVPEEEYYNSLVEGYYGAIGCDESYLVDEKAIKKAADSESFAEEKLQVIKQASKNKCLSTDQVIHIASTFDFEDDRLSFCKWAYDKTYDVDDYYKVNELFTFGVTKSELNEYIESRSVQGLSSGNSGSSNTEVTVPSDYNGRVACFDPLIDDKKVKSLVVNSAFSDEKIMILKQALKNKCITVSQFKDIASTFTFEEDIIEFAKIAYPKTCDQDDFYQVNELLTFDSSKKALNEIIK